MEAEKNGRAIQIRSHFSDWHEADQEHAERYVRYLMDKMPAMPMSEREAYVERRYLRGASVRELLL